MSNRDEIVGKIIHALIEADPAEFGEEDNGGVERSKALANKIADALADGDASREEEQFNVTITIINEDDGPLLRYSSKADSVRTSKFGVLCGVFKELTQASLEAHLEVANQVAMLANAHSQCVCREDEDYDE